MNLISLAGQYKLSVDILLYLTKVPRFEMNAMFLGPIEKDGETSNNNYSDLFLFKVDILSLSFQI